MHRRCRTVQQTPGTTSQARAPRGARARPCATDASPPASLWPSCTYCGRRTVAIAERQAAHHGAAGRPAGGSLTGRCGQDERREGFSCKQRAHRGCRPMRRRRPRRPVGLHRRRGKPVVRPAGDRRGDRRCLLDDPSEDLAAPRGTFLVAQRGETVVGCAGLRLLPDGLGEVKRVFVAPLARGHGLGRRLMLELENLARAEGLRTLRLDTRSDLVEARRLLRRPRLRRGAFQQRPVRRALVRDGLARNDKAA